MKFSEFRKAQEIKHTAYTSVVDALRIVSEAKMITSRSKAVKECGRAIEVVELGIKKEPSKLVRSLVEVSLPLFRQIKKVMER